MKKLKKYIVKGGRRLRMGYTTGACAAAASAAAALLLLDGEQPMEVRIRIPSGEELCLDVEYGQRDGGSATCAVRKDAGDDPDVTDGILVCATLSLHEGGIRIDGGEGVGRVTRPGLLCGVGEAAVNPVPRKMIADALQGVLDARCGVAGLHAVIWAPQGEEIAKRTFNARLGIEGGISILGTTGLVEPMSEGALVSSIRAEIDARHAAGHPVLLLAPGNYGQAYAGERWGIALNQGVKCSNFIGEALDYACYKGFPDIVLLGHAGKLVKLAAGVMQTHSAIADARMEVLACHSALAGLSGDRVRKIFECVTVEEAHSLLSEWGDAPKVWKSIGSRVQFQLEYRVGGRARVAFGAFLSQGTVMQTGTLQQTLTRLKEQEWSK